MQQAMLIGPVMYLWRPAPVVTVGRHQNPWKECVLSQLEADSVALVRRRSGGGAVFMDLGCSTFSLLGPTEYFSIDQNFSVVLGALGRLGVQAERSGRNDITVGDKKISGSAFKHLPDRKVSLHHGTILVDTDMSALQRYLTPDKRKLQAKGIASVGARVMNLSSEFPDISHETWCEAMAGEFRAVLGVPEVPVEHIDHSAAMASEPEFLAYFDELKDPSWRLGRTPEFSHQLETRIDGIGVFDVQLQVEKGIIREAVIFSDALYPDVIDKAMAALRRVQYGRAEVGSALGALSSEVEEGGPRATLEALTTWLVENLDD